MQVKNKYAEKSRNISLAAMFAAMTLIVLYLASILPQLRLTLYFLSSIFVAGLLVENQPGMAMMLYVVVSGLGLLIVPGLFYVLPYVLLFGHYGIGKYFIERLRDKVAAYVLKLAYFNLALAAIYFLVLKADLLLAGELVAELPLWLVIVLAQVAFVIYDFLYSKLTMFYAQKIRRKIVR